MISTATIHTPLISCLPWVLGRQIHSTQLERLPQPNLRTRHACGLSAIEAELAAYGIRDYRGGGVPAEIRSFDVGE